MESPNENEGAACEEVLTAAVVVAAFWAPKLNDGGFFVPREANDVVAGSPNEKVAFAVVAGAVVELVVVAGRPNEKVAVVVGGAVVVVVDLVVGSPNVNEAFVAVAVVVGGVLDDWSSLVAAGLLTAKSEFALFDCIELNSVENGDEEVVVVGGCCSCACAPVRCCVVVLVSLSTSEVNGSSLCCFHKLSMGMSDPRFRDARTPAAATSATTAAGLGLEAVGVFAGVGVEPNKVPDEVVVNEVLDRVVVLVPPNVGKNGLAAVMLMLGAAGLAVVV